MRNIGCSTEVISQKHRPEASHVAKAEAVLLGVVLTTFSARIHNNVTELISYLTHFYNLLLILENNTLCFECTRSTVCLTHSNTTNKNKQLTWKKDTFVK